MEATRRRFRDRLWNPYIVVFLSSACIMVMELVASRLIAPTLGVSLYTWTSVIGVILAGISLGNYIGGRLADRAASAHVLGRIFALAALGSLSVFGWRILINSAHFPSGFPLILKVVLYIAALFFIPSTILGCVSPMVVKLSLTDLQRSGTTVGKIYAWSSVGSIAGTFATGFYLIALFGTKTVMLMVAGLLLLLAFWFLSDAPRRKALPWVLGTLIAFGAILGLLWHKDALASECLYETDYFCIKVHDFAPSEVGGGTEGHVLRELVLDRLVHSYSDVDDPTQLVYGYERTYAEVVQPLAASKPDLAALFIGGGGYTFPRYLEATLPSSHLVVAEIDPRVTETAYEWLGLARDTRIETHNLDARLYLATYGQADSYDLVFGDAFNDYSVPFHLTTLEFAQLVDKVLRDDGLYVVNIIDGGTHGHFLRAYVRTLERVFAHVQVIPTYGDWRRSFRTTFVIVASQQPWDLAGLPPHSPPLSAEELEAYLAEEPARVLTDDYVPVDNLLAPVFVDSERG